MSGVPPPDFLIVGMQKSGSYWLTALLDSHPQIRCFPSKPGHADGTGEAHLFDNLPRIDGDYVRFRKSMSAKLGRWFADLIPKAQPESTEAREALTWAMRARFDEYCQQQRRLAGKPLVGEKTTETVHYPDLVDRLYPGMKKICILRDPRDRAVSFFFHQLRKGRLTDAAVIDDSHVDAYIGRVRQDYDGLLRMQNPLHVMTYEALSAGPLEATRALVAFIGADTEDALVSAMVDAAAFEQLAGRSKGDADAASHFRQGTTGDWRNHLSSALADRMVAALGPLTAQVEARTGLDLSEYCAPLGAPERTQQS